MRPLHPTYRAENQGGFTLVEVVIAIGLGAIVFAALGAYLGSGLKVLAIQKARTQANEIATQGMEDLQRLDDDHLGLCPTTALTAPPVAPADLSDGVPLDNCTGPAVVHDPCANTAPAATGDAVPDDQYECERLNISYKVTRYVAWNNSPLPKSEKYVAVYVNWTDGGKAHEIVQRTTRGRRVQPTVATPMATPAIGIAINDVGLLSGPVVVSAGTTGLTAADTVRLSFVYRDSSDSVAKSAVVAMTTPSSGPTSGSEWTATLSPTSFRVPAGSQYFTVTARRTSDRAEGSATLQYDFACASCPSSSLAVTGTGVAGGQPGYTTSPVNIDSAGVLKSDGIKITATTTDPGSMQVLLPTVTGPRSFPMKFDGCSSVCNWSAIISRATAGTRGFRFLAGTPPFRFVVAQGVPGGRTAVSTYVGATFR